MLEQEPRRCGKQRKRRWRRPRMKRHTVITPTPTEQGFVVPQGLLHDTRICIEDLVDSGRRRRRTPTPTATPRPKLTRSPRRGSATSGMSCVSETNASGTSETSTTSSVETLSHGSYDVSPNSEIGDLARCLPTDLSSYSSDGRHVVYVVHVVPCAPKVPHIPEEIRSRTRPGGL